MKQKIVGLALVTMMMFNTIFAAPIPEKIDRKVQSSFTAKFADANNVHWSNNDKYIKASFQREGEFMYAYYNPEGEFVGVGRNLRVTQLPINLQTQIKKELSGSWISELLEFATDEETTFLATIENADQKILLKANGSASWDILKKNRKD